MNYLFGVSIIILVSTLSSPILGDAIRCYVCGIGSDEPFAKMKSNKSTNNEGNFTTNQTPSSITAPLSCDEFEKNNPKSDKFIMSCPMGYNGCITEIDGSTGNVMRTCDILPLNDCKTANNVAYCYCDKDLCNNIKESTIRRQQFSQIQNHERYAGDGGAMQPTDDEDLNGGSGSHEVQEKHQMINAHTNNNNSNENDNDSAGLLEMETTDISTQQYREHAETTIKSEPEETLIKPPAPKAGAAMASSVNCLLIGIAAVAALLMHG